MCLSSLLVHSLRCHLSELSRPSPRPQIRKAPPLSSPLRFVPSAAFSHDALQGLTRCQQHTWLEHYSAKDGGAEIKKRKGFFTIRDVAFDTHAIIGCATLPKNNNFFTVNEQKRSVFARILASQREVRRFDKNGHVSQLPNILMK